MSKFEVFIGTWNTTGEVLETEASPAGALSATDTYRWLPGQQFIVHDVDARFDSKPTRSMEVMGFDSSKKQYFARSSSTIKGRLKLLLSPSTGGAGASVERQSASRAASTFRENALRGFGSSKEASLTGSHG
jgi:hypothetical protein